MSLTAAEFELLASVRVEIAGLRQAFVDHVAAHEREERTSQHRAPRLAAAAALLSAVAAIAAVLMPLWR